MTVRSVQRGTRRWRTPPQPPPETSRPHPERITRGNVRLLERLFPQISRVLKINQLETIADDIVEAAASTLAGT